MAIHLEVSSRLSVLSWSRPWAAMVGTRKIGGTVQGVLPGILAGRIRRGGVDWEG